MMAVPETRCCCCRLETGVKVIAILFIIFSGVAMIVYLYNLGSGSYGGRGATASLISNLFALLIAVGFIIINILLLIGAVKRDPAKCKLWLIGFPIITILSVIDQALLIRYDPSYRENFIGSIIGIIILIVISIYLFWVVNTYTKEIRNGPPEGTMMMMPQYGQDQVIQYDGNPQMTPSSHPSRNGQAGGFDPSPPPPPQS